MSYSIKDIAKDFLRGKLPVITQEEIAVERMKVCNDCSYKTKLSNQCSLCHCFLDLKTKLVQSSCPIDKW
jgi:hypothetical protein